MKLSFQPYISDPGVVSSSPVSSHVFRPERIIGQPPYSWLFAPSRSWSWVTVSRQESPIGSISQVILEVPSLFTSSPHSATMLWTSLRGGSTSRFTPSPRGPGAPAFVISRRDPRVQSELFLLPKSYLLLISLSVIAYHRRSGVVRM